MRFFGGVRGLNIESPYGKMRMRPKTEGKQSLIPREANIAHNFVEQSHSIRIFLERNRGNFTSSSWWHHQRKCIRGGFSGIGREKASWAIGSVIVEKWRIVYKT